MNEKIIVLLIIIYPLFLLVFPSIFAFNSQEIYIRDFRFDPLVKELDIPSELKTIQDTGYYIIQFKECQYWKNKEQLDKIGVENLHEGAGKEAAVFRFDPL